MTQGAVSAGTSQIKVDVTSADKDNLALTTEAGLSYYYNGAADEAHKLPLAHDDTHKASIALTIRVYHDDGFYGANGDYIITIAVTSPGRLGKTTTGDGNDAYVASNVTLYTTVTVANNTFTAYNRTAYLSVTGADSEQTALTLASSSWTIAKVDSTSTEVNLDA